MDHQDARRVRRVLRTIAAQWGYPVWKVESTIAQSIDQAWEDSQNDPTMKARWDYYFPNGKPTPQEFILRLGRAQETGENIPYLL